MLCREGPGEREEPVLIPTGTSTLQHPCKFRGNVAQSPSYARWSAPTVQSPQRIRRPPNLTLEGHSGVPWLLVRLLTRKPSVESSASSLRKLASWNDRSRSARCLASCFVASRVGVRERALSGSVLELKNGHVDGRREGRCIRYSTLGQPVRYVRYASVEHASNSGNRVWCPASPFRPLPSAHRYTPVPSRPSPLTLPEAERTRYDPADPAFDQRHLQILRCTWTHLWIYRAN